MRPHSILSRAESRAERAPAFLLLAMVLFSPRLCAALVFDQPEQRVAPKIADTQVRLGYRFTNTGPDAVTIIHVSPSCSCTAAALDKSTFQPGEGGTIGVTFTIGGRLGAQTKTITVSTSDPKQPTTVLTLHVDIPEQASFSHRVLSWVVGDKPDPMTVIMSIPSTLAMQVLSVKPHDEHGPPCTASFAPLPGGGYSIIVAPISTVHPGTTTIDVVTNLKIYHVYARVRTAPVPKIAAAPGAPASPAPVAASPAAPRAAAPARIPTP
jgi:hypothetical protein